MEASASRAQAPTLHLLQSHPIPVLHLLLPDLLTWVTPLCSHLSLCLTIHILRPLFCLRLLYPTPVGCGWQGYTYPSFLILLAHVYLGNMFQCLLSGHFLGQWSSFLPILCNSELTFSFNGQNFSTVAFWCFSSLPCTCVCVCVLEWTSFIFSESLLWKTNSLCSWPSVGPWQLYSFPPVLSFSHSPRRVYPFTILALSWWTYFLNDWAKENKQNRTSSSLTAVSAHPPMSGSWKPPSCSGWADASILSSPPTWRHCSSKLPFTPEFSLSTSVLDQFQHLKNMLLELPSLKK